MNFKVKFLAIGIIMVMGAVLLMGAGCVKKAVTPTPAEEGAPAGEAPVVEEEPAPAKQGDIGKMNDDLWVEITAQNNYQTGKDPMGWISGGFDNLLKNKGVTPEQFDAYTKKIEIDLTGMTQLTERVFNRLQELSK